MRNPRIWLAMAVALAASDVFGQDKEPKAAASSNQNQIEVRFADDSVVKMALLQSDIDVTTRYGKLNIPVGEIRRIDFGQRTSAETAKRIDSAIAGLGSPDFKQREAAGATLIELRELAYRPLQRAAKSTDTEVARRAKDAIKTLIETVPSERLQAAQHDTIVAIEFTIVGQVETPILKARTPYFGDANLKLSELRSIRWLSVGRESKLMVDAAKYGGQQDAWLDTGVEVRAGAMLQVAASGRVELNSQNGFGGGNMVVGPDGQFSRGGRVGGFNPNGAAGGVGGRGGRGGAPGRGSSMSAGALLGRIGENGAAFFLGSRYEAPAHEDGKLYLRIMPSPDGAQPSGSYDVRVTSGR